MTVGRRIQRVAEAALVAILVAWGVALLVCGQQLLDALDRVITA